MPAYLELWGAGRSRMFPLEGAVVTVGRSPDNVVVVQDASASRLHAILEDIGGRWLVSDAGSRNGTFVNGERLVGIRALRGDDELRVGDTRFVFREQAADRDRLERTQAAEPPPALTRREREVLLVLCRPSADDVYWTPPTVRGIAEQLHVSEANVKQHLSRLYGKFGLGDGADRRARLANEALRRGAVTLAEVQAGRPR